MEPGRKEMWDFGRAATGFDDDALCSMLGCFNRADAATMLALKETLGALEPRKAANVLRNLIHFMRDDVGIVPLDAPITVERSNKTQRTQHEPTPMAGLGASTLWNLACAAHW